MIIDFHTHIFPDWICNQREKYFEIDATLNELYANPKASMSNVNDLLVAMDDDGVDMSVVMGIGWADYSVAQKANDYIIESVSRYPDRLIGFAGVNPAWGDIACLEVERCVAAGLRGLGELHPDTQKFDLGNESTMYPLMEMALKHQLIVTTHSSELVGHCYPGKGRTHPEILLRFIRNFPEVRIVCAHWGGGLPFYALMPEVNKALSNVYFDTAASPFLYNPQVFNVVSSLVGTDRILMGSDFPLLRGNRFLEQMARSNLTVSEIESVSGGNAFQLLNT